MKDNRKSKYMGTKVYSNGYTRSGSKKIFKDIHLCKFSAMCKGTSLSAFISYDNKNVVIKPNDWSSPYYREVIHGTETGFEFIGTVKSKELLNT